MKRDTSGEGGEAEVPHVQSGSGCIEPKLSLNSHLSDTDRCEILPQITKSPNMHILPHRAAHLKILEKELDIA